MTEIQTLPSVNWWMVVVDLERHGYTHSTIAAAIGGSRSSVQDWKNLDSEPRHFHGERLAALWRAVTGRPREDMPLRSDMPMSAKMFKDTRSV